MIKKSNFFIKKNLKKLNIFYLITILMIFNLNCSIILNEYHQSNTTQGTYFTQQNIKKIKIGMTKSQVLSHTKLMPTLQNLFQPNTWYYIYYRYNEKTPPQYQIITLIFDLNDTLIDIKIVNNI